MPDRAVPRPLHPQPCKEGIHVMWKSTSTQLIVLGILAVIVGIIAIAWPGVTVSPWLSCSRPTHSSAQGCRPCGHSEAPPGTGLRLGSGETAGTRAVHPGRAGVHRLWHRALRPSRHRCGHPRDPVRSVQSVLRQLADCDGRRVAPDRADRALGPGGWGLSWTGAWA